MADRFLGLPVWKQINDLTRAALVVLAKKGQELIAEDHVAVFLTLAHTDVYGHPLDVDICMTQRSHPGNLQSR